MVPLADELIEAGHEVAFATEKEFSAHVVEAAGFRSFPAGISRDAATEETKKLPEVAELGDRIGWYYFLVASFTRVAAPAKLVDLVEIIRQWQADLVVHDAIDFGAPIACAHTGIPWASHSYGELLPEHFWALSASVMAPTWRAWGLEPGPLAGMFRYLYLDICPPTLQAALPPHWPVARVPDVLVTHLMRPMPFDPPNGGSLPEWFASLPDRPNVYLTMGTVVNTIPGLFEGVLEGLGGGPFNVIVTVGPDRDPTELEPLPPNVHAERWLRQSALLPHCDAVVCHGGWGTILAALAHGLPLLIVPPLTDHFYNSLRCASVGAALRLPGAHLDSPAVYRAVCDLLEQPRFRSSARHLSAEIEQMPPPAQVVPVLEKLARDRRPIFGQAPGSHNPYTR
jgi:UDP:flavonoid glycosyltransferase YjiC (YdhE family)